MLQTSDEELRLQLLETLVDNKLTGPMRQLVQNDPRRLPERELPHGCMANLFLLYLAWCRASSKDHASKSTFYSVGHVWMTTCLKFHRKSCHAVCLTCSQLKTAIREAKDFKTHALKCDELLAHYTLMFRDREIYWLARDRSESQKDLLTMIIDSYDKAKVQLPRWPMNRTPKRPIYEATRSALTS